MIDAIIGHKGSGKTAKLVNAIVELAGSKDNNIVCIESGKRFDQSIPYTVRLIDINEFPVQGYDQLLAFISGMNAKDYDISHLFIDSVYKVAKVEGAEGLESFIESLEQLSEKAHVHMVLTISEDPENLPESVLAHLNPLN